MVDRIATSQIRTHAINSIIDQEMNLTAIQQQISTGKSILSPADNPIDTATILSLTQELETNNQYLKNVNSANSMLEYEDATLKGVNDSITRIRELTIAAGDGVLDTSSRGFIVAEIQQRLSQLVDIANTRNANGEYIFSGFKGLVTTVALNIAGQYVYGGDEGQRQVAVGSSTEIPINDTGKDLFFKIPSAQISATTYAGLAGITTSSSGLINVTPSSAFNGLAINQLFLNNQAIPAATGDGVSNLLPTASAIATANAINVGSAVHRVTAFANANVLNMGILTTGVINSGDFELNGISITSAAGTESDIIAQINFVSESTGIVATQPGGAGSSVILTAADGRNIELTTGAAFNTFIIGASVDKVQRAAVTLFSDQAFSIGGSNPSVVELSGGTVNVTGNTGRGTAEALVISEPTLPLTTPYTIRFSAENIFSVYADTEPNTPLTGFSNVSYVEGSKIDFNGVRVIINGSPATGDSFSISLKQDVQEDIFTTIQTLITALLSEGNEPARLSYDLGVALQNLDNAEISVLQVRAQVGARMNILGSQKVGLNNYALILQQNISTLSDLNYNEAISNLTQLQFQLEAAQRSFVRIQGLSLFNFFR